MRCVVIHIDRPSQAKQLAEWLGADVMEYTDDAFEGAFQKYEVIIAVMASGIVVRKLSPLIRGKWVDPAVVVVTPDLVLHPHPGGTTERRSQSWPPWPDTRDLHRHRRPGKDSVENSSPLAWRS